MPVSYPAPQPDDISAVILAGGRGQRMADQDKGWLPYQDSTLIEHSLRRLQQQTSRIYISANRNLARYQQLGVPIVEDQHADYPGPLAGIYSVLATMTTNWLLTLPCDTPHFPNDLLARMVNAISKEPHSIAVARDEHYLQPVFCLIHRSLAADLKRFLDQGHHKVGQWLRQQQPLEVMFNNSAQAFFNINNPQDLQQAAPLTSGESP